MCSCFKQKTAYEVRISDWSSDVCSSDLLEVQRQLGGAGLERGQQGNHELGAAFQGQCHHAVVADALGAQILAEAVGLLVEFTVSQGDLAVADRQLLGVSGHLLFEALVQARRGHRQLHTATRSEEHTSELQSLMRNSYAVFCLQKTTNTK